MPTKKPRSLNAMRKNDVGIIPDYKCTRCGKTKDTGKGAFFISRCSPLFTANEGYANICNDCAYELYDDLKNRYDEKTSLIIMCHYLDVYFSEDLYEMTKDNANFSFGNYLKNLNGIQYKSKNFTTYLISLYKNGAKSREEIVEAQEEKWSTSDLRNKKSVIDTIGYDCFADDSYSYNDLKYLYNTLADYLTDDVISDPHKVQSVISLVKTLLQLENINKIINREFKPGSLPNDSLLKSLTDTKLKFNTIINTIADENGIAAKTNGKSKSGTNTLTAIMKKMVESDYEDIKVNYIDAKTSESYKEIANINAKAITNELMMQSDEYASLVAKQAELLRKYQDDIDKLKEENRLLKLNKSKGGGSE
eukprot:TRINITY_DN11600_c0_g1_i1.p1 TRINITY_DN11600_c0_g1~~TRINITY_DN11600_c0_g1_i1.p1  ORF type:complete len:364 (+),score=48.62 TRINITY_DN11600_c0_g1_i1:521-1612(+)